MFLAINTIAIGHSYWKVKLNSGKEISELGMSFDLLRGTRSIEWLEDIVGSGDNARIAAITLCTPHGNATLLIGEAYTTFQLKQGTMTISERGTERILQAQIIGRVDDKATGECTAVIWDVLEQRLYTDFKTNVRDFAAWRPGTMPIGALHLDVVGVRL